MKATFEGCDARDMIDRPVLIPPERYVVHYITAAPDADTVTVTPNHQWLSNSGGSDEPITLPLIDCTPLCIHCLKHLEESETEGPGECHTAGCFMSRS